MNVANYDIPVLKEIDGKCILSSPFKIVSLEKNRTGPFPLSNFCDTAEVMNVN